VAQRQTADRRNSADDALLENHGERGRHGITDGTHQERLIVRSPLRKAVHGEGFGSDFVNVVNVPLLDLRPLSGYHNSFTSTMRFSLRTEAFALARVPFDGDGEPETFCGGQQDAHDYDSLQHGIQRCDYSPG
jgi:hypothetical protein